MCILNPPLKWMWLPKVNGLGTAIQASEMRIQFERTPAIGSYDFVNSVSKLKATIFDRNRRPRPTEGTVH